MKNNDNKCLRKDEKHLFSLILIYLKAWRYGVIHFVRQIRHKKPDSFQQQLLPV